MTGSSAAEISGYTVGTWDIDPVHSHIGFSARHLMVSKVRGNFTTFEGQVVTAADPLQSSATATIEMSSFETNSEQRNADVKGEGFLDVAHHPQMTFRSTAVRAGSDSDQLLVTGDLTIKGVTRPVELAVEVNGFGPDPYGGTRAGFSATGEINRNDFGITATFALPTGGVMVSEKIQLSIEVEATLRMH